MGLTVPAMRPAAWEMTPSGKGMRIGVAGLTRTIERIQEQHRRRGVTHATFVAMQDAEDVAREATTCAVVCVSPRDFGRIEWAEVARVTTAAVRERGIPLAVVGDAPSHAAAWLHLLNVPHLALPEIESPDLVRRMRQLIVEPLQSVLGQRVQRAALGNPTCEEDFLEALRALIEQEIRPPDEALDMLASRRPPYVRRVRDLPLQDKGSVSAIEKDARAARVPLSRLVTQVEGLPSQVPSRARKAGGGGFQPWLQGGGFHGAVRPTALGVRVGRARQGAPGRAGRARFGRPGPFALLTRGRSLAALARPRGPPDNAPIVLRGSPRPGQSWL